MRSGRQTLEISALSMGTRTRQVEADVDAAPVQTQGRASSITHAFRRVMPATCRSWAGVHCVFERAVPARRAGSGTGPAQQWWPASMWIARQHGAGVDARRKLRIAWEGGRPVVMTGPAEMVFEEIELSMGIRPEQVAKHLRPS